MMIYGNGIANIFRADATNNLGPIVNLKASKEFLESFLERWDSIRRGIKTTSAIVVEGLEHMEENTYKFANTVLKGLERKVVFVIGMEKGEFPKSNSNVEEERRLFYVAMTRAKDKLFLCYAKKREGQSAQGVNFYDPSPFIFEIPYIEPIRPTT